MLTLSTCWYPLKSKFGTGTYYEWIKNILSITQNFNLVIYTDSPNLPIFRNVSERVKIIYMPHTSWHNHKYAPFWQKNQIKNHLLAHIDWKVNCLWAEKISFVKRTIENNLFPDSEWHGWCDIGYFRGRSVDTPITELVGWPKIQKINTLSPNKIYYGVVQKDQKYLINLIRIVRDRNDSGIPRTPVPPDQVSVAAGFFLIHKQKVQWYWNLFDDILRKYIAANRLVKDDQIIVINCIFNNLDHFNLWQEQSRYDNWFMFQRLLR